MSDVFLFEKGPITHDGFGLHILHDHHVNRSTGSLSEPPASKAARFPFLARGHPSIIPTSDPSGGC
jgi:hypothetical protein